MSRITPSVVHKHYNKFFTVTPLSAVSVCPNEPSREEVDLFLEPGLGKTNYTAILRFPLYPYQCSKLVHFICQWSPTFHNDLNQKIVKTYFFLSILFLTWFLDLSSSTNVNLESYSRHYLGFGKLNQLLWHANNFSVAMVMKNPPKITTSELMYLLLKLVVTTISFSQHLT